MVYNPNPNWTTETAKLDKRPVYFINIAGLTTKEYATRPVKSPVIAKKIFMKTPSGTSQRVQRIHGRTTVGSVKFELVDEAEDITDLVSTDKAAGGGAPTLSSLVNRIVKLFGGYTDLVEADYAKIFTGRISGLQMGGGGSSYIITISDSKRKFHEPIMTSATDKVPTVIEGNIVNIFYAILADDFSTGGNFPLASFSGSPTGLGIPTADINTADLIDQRDTWLQNFTVKFEFDRQESSARQFIERELMRLIGFAVVFADGSISMRVSNPPLVLTASPRTLDENNIIGQPRWRRRFDLHFNRIRILGDHNFRRVQFRLDGAAASGQNIIPIDSVDGIRAGAVMRIQSQDRATSESITVATIGAGQITTTVNLANSYISEDTIEALAFPTELGLSEDTADQSDTGETVEFTIESRGLRTALNGVNLATNIATRLKRRYVNPPIEIIVETLFTQRALEVGDVVLLSHPNLPDPETGTMGITNHAVEIIRVDVDFQRGRLVMQLLDTVPQSRFSIIAPDSTPDYLSASAAQRASFGFICDNTTEEMSNGDQPYLVI